MTALSTPCTAPTDGFPLIQPEPRRTRTIFALVRSDPPPSTAFIKESPAQNLPMFLLRRYQNRYECLTRRQRTQGLSKNRTKSLQWIHHLHGMPSCWRRGQEITNLDCGVVRVHLAIDLPNQGNRHTVSGGTLF